MNENKEDQTNKELLLSKNNAIEETIEDPIIKQEYPNASNKMAILGVAEQTRDDYEVESSLDGEEKEIGQLHQFFFVEKKIWFFFLFVSK